MYTVGYKPPATGSNPGRAEEQAPQSGPILRSGGLVTINGSTTAQGIPAAAVLLALALGLRSRGARSRVVGTFLIASGTVALGFIAVYVAVYGWPLPELTQMVLRS